MTWRWPWVSRAQLESAEQENATIVEQLLQQMGKLRDELQAGQARYERLVERTITMQRDGFQVVKPPAEEEPAKPFPPAVEQAIADRAFDPITERRLRMYASQALAVPQADAEQVATTILTGEQLSEEYET